jgi:hypothetical protein
MTTPAIVVLLAPPAGNGGVSAQPESLEIFEWL